MIKVEIEEVKIPLSKIKPIITKENQNWLDAILGEVRLYNDYVRRLNKKINFCEQHIDLDKNLTPYYKDLYED
jgi:hypothetical protein